MNDCIYLDNAASTQPYPEVVEEIYEILKNDYGNSSSIHLKGISAHKIIKNASETIAEILNCLPEEIVFTSGGAESNNHAIKGSIIRYFDKDKNIVTSAFEHPTVLNTIKNLKIYNVDVSICGISDDGKIKDCDVVESINNRTVFASIMMVNSEIGTYTDMGELSKKIKEKNNRCIVHTDAVQAFCKIPLDVKLWRNIDLLSISSHKIKGPKGVGALFLRKGININPLIDGGDHQLGRRSGTENTAGIAGFALAAKISAKNMNANFIHVEKLNAYLKNKIKNTGLDFIINSPDNASPYILNVAFKGIKAEVLLNYLSGKNIFVSAGSACSSKEKKTSHVLEAMHIPSGYIEGAIRISFNPLNFKEEIDILINEITSIIPMLLKTRRL